MKGEVYKRSHNVRGVPSTLMDATRRREVLMVNID